MVHDIWWWCGLLFLLQWRHRVSYFESLGEYIDEVGFFEGKVVDLVANIRFIAVWRKAIRWVAFCPYFKDDHWLDTPIIIRLPIWAESNNANVSYGNFKGFPKNNSTLFGARCHINFPCTLHQFIPENNPSLREGPTMSDRKLASSSQLQTCAIPSHTLTGRRAVFANDLP